MLHSDEGNIFDLARHRLDVAKEDLETAISNLKEEHYRAANNRAYYSIYHSICAFFALENVAYKRHKDTLANFNKNYIKTEIFSKDLGRKISKAQTVRHNSDYDDFYLITKEETVQQIETAEQLLDAVEIYIEDKIRENKRK